MRVQDIPDLAQLSWPDQGNLVRATNETLVRLGQDNRARPWLLSRWSASSDLRSWTFEVRDGVRWSNGDALTAQQVAWNIRRWIDEAIGSHMKGRMGGLSSSGVRVQSSHRLQLSFDLPKLGLPAALGHYNAAIAHPASRGRWGANQPGTGPFRLVSHLADEGARFVARQDYWGPGPFVDELQFIDMGDDSSQKLAALASGQVDLVDSLGAGDIAGARTERLQIHEIPTGSTAVARMKVTRKAFTDRRVRKAMRLAIDPAAVVAAVRSARTSPAEHHHMAPIHEDYPSLPRVGQNLREARQLMAEAGWPQGFSTELNVNRDPPWNRELAQAMQGMWSRIGINVRLNVLPGAQFWESWDQTDFGLTPWAHRPYALQILNLAYRSGQPWNDSEYSSSTLDRLLDEASRITDPVQRRPIMARIGKHMLEEGPICQPIWIWAVTASSSRLRGFQMHPTGEIHAEELWLDG